MSLGAGSRLGHYEILGTLGAGGMGEVYRARDERLGREVAIKILAEALAADPNHLARFEREARLLASLNHPNVAAIHGLEEADGVRWIVLELVPGETLAERTAAGPLGLADAIAIARQIAEALEAAHARGVIHRDLKPANVKVTPEGRVKVLDFGLAKSLAGTDGASSSAPTRAADATRDGTVLGTPSYMSPEQARGKELDRRTDLWSFGCVLYELLAARRAFPGETASDILAAILTAEPDWSALPRDTPENVLRLLRRCLEKDPARRLRDAGDARLELEAPEVSSEPARPAARAAPGRPGRLATLWSSIPTLFGAPRGKQTPIPPAPSARPRLSQATFADAIEGSPAFSPDGGRLAFTREAGGRRRIVVKDLGTGEERAVTTGESDDLHPAWRPDGRELLFARAQVPGKRVEPHDVFGEYHGTDVWALDPESGRETRLVRNAANPSVSPDGARIAFDASWAGPRRLWTADARGVNPKQASTDSSEAVAHVRPRWSPDGRRIVFQNMERTRFDVRVLDVATQELASVTSDHLADYFPVWSPSGRYIYFSSFRSGGLNVWRIPVDAAGRPAGVMEQLTTGAGQDLEAALSPDGKRLAFSIVRQNADIWRLPVAPETGRPTGEPEKWIATTREDSRGAWSPDGRLVAFNSDRSGDMNVWIFSTAEGSARPLTSGPGGDFQPRFSPDGERVVFFSSRQGAADVWIADVRAGRTRRLTDGRAIRVNPCYSPDGRRIAYMSDESGRLEVWMMDGDGGSARRLTDVGVLGHFLLFTADGESVLFRCPSPTPRTMRVAVEGGEPEPTAEVVGGAHMSLSPDGSRVLDVLAHKALWVSPLSGGAPEKVFEFSDPDVRIDYPFWSPDGRWVLFDRFRPEGGDVWVLDGVE